MAGKKLTNNGSKKPSPVVAGLDLGHSKTKCVFGAHSSDQFSFDSVTLTTPTLNVGAQDIIGDYPGFVLNENGVMVMVGEPASITAGEHTEKLVQVNGWEYGRLPEFRLNLIKAAFAHRFQNIRDGGAVSVRLCVGLPIDLMDKSHDLKSAWLGQHRVRTFDGVDFVLNIVHIHVAPEGLAAIYAQQLTDAGGLNRKFAFTRIATVDLGYYSTDITLQIGGKMSNSNSSSGAGVREVYQYLQTELKRAIGVMPTRNQVMGVILTGKASFFGLAAEDFRSLRRDAVKGYADNVLNKIAVNVGEAAEVQRINVVGGGSELIFDTILDKYRQSHQPENPVFQNAIGFWKYALMQELQNPTVSGV